MPAAVPSLTQSSIAVPPPDGSVVKKSRLPAAVAVRIGGPTDPGTPAPCRGPEGLHERGPRRVPSLTQRLGPCPATSARRKPGLPRP